MVAHACNPSAERPRKVDHKLKPGLGNLLRPSLKINKGGLVTGLSAEALGSVPRTAKGEDKRLINQIQQVGARTKRDPGPALQGEEMTFLSACSFPAPSSLMPLFSGPKAVVIHLLSSQTAPSASLQRTNHSPNLEATLFIKLR